MDGPFPKDYNLWLKEFMQKEQSRMSGLGIYEDVFRSPIFPLQRKRELREMLRLSIDARVVMEIGTDKGGGFYHFLKNCIDLEKAIGCEIRGCPWESSFKEAFPHVDIHCILDSRNVNSVKSFLEGELIDMLFIDGDKGRFYEDFLLYLPLMALNGIVFVHDIQDAVPRKGFDKIKEGKRWSVIINTTEWITADDSEHGNWLKLWKGESCGVGVIHL